MAAYEPEIFLDDEDVKYFEKCLKFMLKMINGPYAVRSEAYENLYKIFNPYSQDMVK